MIYSVEIGGHTREIEVRSGRDGRVRVRVDGGAERQLSGAWLGAGAFAVHDGARNRVHALVLREEEVLAQVSGRSVAGWVRDPRRAALDMAAASVEGRVVTPMPGVVARIGVEAGQTVQQGDVLLVIEAMKMENEFRSPCAGVVAEVHVGVGEAVDAHAALVTVEPV